jgi:hypothetical protein
MQFTAIYVEADTNNAVANVIFADPETNPDEPMVLMFSRSTEFQDSTYYFEINDQSYGRYGGLTSVQLSRTSIELKLEPDVIKEFGDENFTEVKVEFTVNDETYQSIVTALKSIFANTDVLIVK